VSRRLLALVVLPLVLAGCGTARNTAATTDTGPAPAPVPASPAPMDVVAYYLRDGAVAPVRLEAPHSRAVATAALDALVDTAPPDGLETALPEGTRLVSLTIDAGVAHPAFSGELDRRAQAQVVYTLTRFPSVTGVALPGTGEPLTREDFEAETPRILIETPLPGATVSSPLDVRGTSNDYEATFQLELVQDGRTIVQKTVTASSGSGVRGTYAEQLAFEATGPATLVAYERSAGEGPPELGRVEIPLVLR
jgi:germination protein M